MFIIINSTAFEFYLLVIIHNCQRNVLINNYYLALLKEHYTKVIKTLSEHVHFFRLLRTVKEFFESLENKMKSNLKSTSSISQRTFWPDEQESNYV